MNDENKNKNKDIDKVTGVETTGHEWDGLKELNNPLPRWWLWVFFVCIIWSAWYCVIYPAWPTLTGHTKGTGDYTQFNELAKNQEKIATRQKAYLDRFDGASFDEIMSDQELYAFAMAGGASVFKDNCATCHGTGGAGAKGYPNLNDDDWLWGGTLSEIHQTLKHGIRAGNIDSRISQMPAFGRDKLLNKHEIETVAHYVHSLSEHPQDITSSGGQIFKMQCASCHGEDARGNKEFGAPNLTDKIWLYGGDEHSIYETIYNARAGVMPAWKERLNKNTLKQLTVYLHQLGGGEEEPKEELKEEPQDAMLEPATTE